MQDAVSDYRFGIQTSAVSSAAAVTLLDLATRARGARRHQPASGGLIRGVCEAPQSSRGDRR
jgi:hypothetical protein